MLFFKLTFFFITSFATYTTSYFDYQINNYLKNFFEDKLYRGSHFKINTKNLFLNLEDGSNLKSSFKYNNGVYASYKIFEFWPNSDLLFFITSNEIAKKLTYLDNLKEDNLINKNYPELNIKYIADIDGTFSELEKSLKNNNKEDEDLILNYNQFQKVKQYNITITQRCMRNIHNIDIFMKQDSSEITKYKNKNNLLDNDIKNYKQLYLNDFDKYNKIRNLKEEDEFNIARAKIIALFSDRSELFLPEELKYFDVRLKNNIPKYKLYFDLYKLAKDRNFQELQKKLTEKNNHILNSIQEEILDLKSMTYFYLNKVEESIQILKDQPKYRLLYIILLIKNYKKEYYYNLKKLIKNSSEEDNISEIQKEFFLSMLYKLNEETCNFYEYNMKVAEKLTNEEEFCDSFLNYINVNCNKIKLGNMITIEKNEKKCKEIEKQKNEKDKLIY